MSALKRLAFSSLTIKGINEEKRIVEGIATTPSTDRYGDVVEPEGAVYTLPLPFLSQHNSREPIGEVFWAKVSKAGIEFKASVAQIIEVGMLKDRIDKAWQEIKYKLVKGTSIGFTEIETALIKDSYSYHFLKWNWLELSAVTIPANADASITNIRSAVQDVRRRIFLPGASGMQQNSSAIILPGAPGSNQSTEGVGNMKTIREQITAWEQKRAANVARRDEIQSKASEAGRVKDEAEKEEFDRLNDEIKVIDGELVDLRSMEAQAVAHATPAPQAGAERTAVQTPDVAAGVARSGGNPGGGVVLMRPNIEKGIAFTRYTKALILAKGSLGDALTFAQNQKQWQEETPQVATVLKAAVAGGDTTTVGWASELVYAQNLANEFIEFLRPMTVLGRIPGLTRVPFNVRMSGADQGTSANWVGQGKPVPVSKMHTLAVTLGIAKAAGLVVLTEELVRSSTPSAELMVRNDLGKAIGQFLDQQFLSPDYAAVANVSPASMTNGVNPTAASGTTAAALRTDVQTLFNLWITQNLDPTGGVWIMPATTALSISLMLNALGQPVFPDITMNGGKFFGLPVITSQSAVMVGSPVSGEGNMIILLNAPEVLLADDGQITVDASREASIEMLDNPTNNSAAGTPTTMVSMFQTNSVAIKAVRFINWAKRRSFAVQYIKDAAYVT